MADGCGVSVFWNEDEAAGLIEKRWGDSSEPRPNKHEPTWQEMEARAISRMELTLDQWRDRDDSCYACERLTVEACERLGQDEYHACNCSEETVLAAYKEWYGPEYRDVWGDEDPRSYPFSPELMEDLGATSPSAEDEYLGSLTSTHPRFVERCVDTWARTDKERAFLEALAAGHNQGEACRLSSLSVHQARHLLSRIRRLYDAQQAA
jgi:hypothetical protein